MESDSPVGPTRAGPSIDQRGRAFAIFLARRLSLTASAISNQIAALEATLGFRLFERTTRRVILTAEGREFLPAAIEVQRQIARLGLIASDIRDRRKDIVKVAAPLSIGASLLPALIAAFGKTHPDVHVRVLDTGVEWLSDRVATGEADLALGPDRVASPDVIAQPLFASPWVAWCAPSHPMAAIQPLTWRDACKWDFYAAGRDHEHSIVPKLPADIGGQFIPVQVVDNVTTALGLAAVGVGFTCSPAYLRAFAAAMGLVMQPLNEPLIVRFMTLYRPRERNLSVSAAEFGAFVEQEAPFGGAHRASGSGGEFASQAWKD